MFADSRIGPDFERADFGQSHAQLHRDGTLFGLLAEADHGLQRRVQVQVGIVRIELDHVAELVLGAHERTVQPERDGLVRDELQVVAIDLERRAFFAAARQRDRRCESSRPLPPMPM